MESVDSGSLPQGHSVIDALGSVTIDVGMSSLAASVPACHLPVADRVHRPGQRRHHTNGGVRSAYDSSQTTRSNERHWSQADGLSAAAAASPGVRRIHRNRARYENDNSTYIQGIKSTLSTDTIGTGPKLNIHSDDTDGARFVEKEFARWCKKTKFAAKLRTMKNAKTIDGEAFALLISNPRINHPVKLDLRLLEGEQVSTPNLLTQTDLRVDGIVFDEAHNPIEYHILKYHPGNLGIGGFSQEFDRVPAENVIHFFREDRPGQPRGISEVQGALPLAANLRRYTIAVIEAAETAANHSGIIYSDAPANIDPDEDDIDTLEPLDTVTIDRNVLTTLPMGYKMEQMKAEQPTTTYKEFKGEVLNEIARCESMPRNIATADSSGYNYSSGRLDHQIYFNQIDVERSEIEIVILDVVFSRWMSEAALIADYLPDSFRVLPENVDHEWHWNQPISIDPVKDYTADEIALRSGQKTYADVYSKDGRDWEPAFEQMAREKKKMKELGLSFAGSSSQPPGNNKPPSTSAPSGDPNEDPNQNDNIDEEDPQDQAEAA